MGINVNVHAVPKGEVVIGKVFRIENNTGSSLTDYPVAISLDSTNWDWNYGVAGVEDTNGNIIPHWVEYWDTTYQKGLVWIKVTLLSGESIDVILRYGDLSWGSIYSVGFYFADHFDSPTLDTSKWVSTGGVYSISNSIIQLGPDPDVTSFIRTDWILDPGKHYYAKAKIQTYNAYVSNWQKNGISVHGDPTANKVTSNTVFDITENRVEITRYKDGVVQSEIGLITSAGRGNWFLFVIEKDKATYRHRAWRLSDWKYGSGSWTAYDVECWFQCFSHAGVWAKFDWVYIKEIIADPTVTLIGDATKEWTYYSEFVITEQSGSNLTDYQVRITLDSTSWDWTKYLVAVEDENGNILSHWVEEWDDVSRSAVVWVKIPYLPANGSVKIKLVGGNSLNRGIGEAVFDFFDDFEVDLNKWTITATSSTSVVRVTTAKAKSGSKSVEAYQTVDDGDTFISKDFGMASARIVRAWFYDTTSVTGTIVMRTTDGSWPGAMIGVRTSTSSTKYVYRVGNTWYATSVSRTTGWHEFKWVSDGSTIKAYIDGVLVYTYNIPGIRYIQFGSWWTVSGAGIYADCVMVRKYVSVEPSVGYVASGARVISDLDTSNVAVAVSKVIVTEQSGNDLTDYQVMITLDSTNWNWKYKLWRVVDENGNICKHWIEEWDENGKTAIVWVKVPNIPANGTVTIYLYGHEEWLVSGNPEEVFEFFDDFNDDIIDTSKWTVIGNGVSESNGTIIFSPGSSAWCGIVSKNSFPLGFSFVAKLVQRQNSELQQWISDYMPSDNPWSTKEWYRHMDQSSYYYVQRYTGSDGSQVTLLRETREYSLPTVFEIRTVGNTIRFYTGNVLQYSETISGTFSSVYLVLGSWSGTGQDKVDYCYLRKYVDPEPNISVVRLL